MENDTYKFGSTTLVFKYAGAHCNPQHGMYSARPEDPLRRGQPVGFESDPGNTVDLQGVSCYGRDCDYQPHLTVEDKLTSRNSNHLELFP